MVTQTEPQDWAFIVAGYQNLNTHDWGHERMLALVQHIVSSGAANRLFAYTSHDVLKVSYHEPMDDTGLLIISFDRQKQVFCFEYYGIWGPGKLYDHEQPEFRRQYSAEKGIEKFDQFLRWIRW